MTDIMDQHSPGILQRLFGVAKPIIGMMHALPLPGSPRGRICDMERVYAHAVEEARRLEQGGVDGILIENAGDIPFLKPQDIGHETVAAMAVVGDRMRQAVKVPIGFNIVANAAEASLACAKAAGAAFVRVNQWANAYVANEGFVEGAAARALRYRSRIDADGVVVLADVHVKHGSHAIVADRSVSEQARDVEFFGADIVIATGSRTGAATELEEVEDVRAGTRLPVLVGSGLTAENAATLLASADGAVVGSWFKATGDMWGEVVVDHVARLMDEVRRLRAA